MKEIFAIEERDHHTLNLILDGGERIVVQKDTGPYAVGGVYGQPEPIVGVLAEDIVGMNESGDEVTIKAGEEVIIEPVALVEEVPAVEEKPITKKSVFSKK